MFIIKNIIGVASDSIGRYVCVLPVLYLTFVVIRIWAFSTNVIGLTDWYSMSWWVGVSQKESNLGLYSSAGGGLLWNICYRGSFYTGLLVPLSVSYFMRIRYTLLDSVTLLVSGLTSRFLVVESSYWKGLKVSVKKLINCFFVALSIWFWVLSVEDYGLLTWRSY